MSESHPPKASSATSSSKELIGGFGANDSQLNAIGSMLIMYSDPFGTSFDLVCSGSLIEADTVVTAKHCLDVLNYYGDYGYQIVFALGPNSFAPTKWSEVIAAEPAPGDTGGFNGYGHDVAVLHLATPFEGVTPVALGSLTDSDLGQDFAAMGFGDQNNAGGYGTRLVGGLELRANEGKTFELILGSFEAFYEWYWGQPLPPECADVQASDGGFIVLGPAIATPSLPGSEGRGGPAWGAAHGGGHSGAGGKGGSGGGASGTAGAGGRGDSGGRGGSGGSAGEPPDGGELDGGEPDGGFVDCFLAEYARSIYDSVTLEQMNEVLAGGTPGDSQPCYGDSGSPLLRTTAAGLTAYGTVSGGLSSRAQRCDYGAIYATFDAEVREFLEQAKNWVDPCDGLSSAGVCDGTYARRCSRLTEGPRRLLEFDCANVGLSCEPQGNGNIGCGTDDSSFAPPPPSLSPDVVVTSPRDLLAPVFKRPAR